MTTNQETTMHAQSPAPNRTTGSATISIGLLTLPLGLYSAIERAPQPLTRGEFTDTGNRCGRATTDKETGAIYTGPVIKKAQHPEHPDTWVEITDDELAEATSLRKGHADVECFIPLSAIGDTYVEDGTRWQVRPAKTKQGTKRVDDPAATKTFALVMDRLADREQAALIRLATRGPARFMALCPDGTLRTLAFARQVRQPLPMPDAEFTAAESALADKLFDAIGVDTPVLVDEARAAAEAYLAAKATGATPEPAAEAEAAPAVDLLAALEASLAAKAA